MPNRFPAVRRTLLVALLAPLTLGALCDKATAPPVPPVMSRVSVNNQEAVNGTAVAIAPSVRVLAESGSPVEGVPVRFRVLSGGGKLTGHGVATDANGIATVGSWVLGTSLGTNTIEAVSDDATGGPILFFAASIAGPPAVVVPTSAASVEVMNGEVIRPSVKVTDASGHPLNGVSVTFAVTTGSGTVSGATQLTNVAGIAIIGGWGPALGTSTLSATADGFPEATATFTATASVGAPNRFAVVTPPSPSPSNRVPFAVQPVVQVVNLYGKPVPLEGKVVTALASNGGGTVLGTTTSTTDAQGMAAFTDLALAGLVGPRSLIFRASGLGDGNAAVTLGPGLPTTITVHANDNQAGGVGLALATVPSVKVTDADGNAVPGVSVTFAVAGGGGSGTGLTQTTNASGIASPGSWTLGAEGLNTMTATADGVAASALTLKATAALVFVTSVAPAILTPGIIATVAGTGFSTTLAANIVTVDGMPATVTAASSSQMTFTVPHATSCQPTHDASISVTVGAYPAATITKPYQMATQRDMSAGEGLILEPSEHRCNEFTPGRYLIAIANTSTAYNTVGVGFQLRGAAASGVGGLAAGEAAAVRAPLTPEGRRGGLLTRPPAATLRARQMHRRILEHNIAFGAANRSRIGVSGPRSNRSIAVPVVGDVVSLNLPNLNNEALCEAPIPMTGRIAYVGTRSIIVEDNANNMAGQIDSTYRFVGTEFDNVMFPLLTTNFGNPLALDGQTDNNQRIVMVFSNKVRQHFPGVGGFVVGCDFAARNGTTNTQSNLGEYFYAIAPVGPGNSQVQNSPPWWRWTMLPTIIHEVKHITSFAERISRGAATLETQWLEEATATLAEEFYERSVSQFFQRSNSGYGSDAIPVGPYCGVRGNLPEWTACFGRPRGFIGTFEELADGWYANPRSRSPLGSFDGNDFSFYSTGWSLVRWAVDHAAVPEATFVKQLIQEASLTGVANLEARAGRSFAAMLPEWGLAMAADDYPALGPIFGSPSTRMLMPSWNLRSIYQGHKLDFGQQTPWDVWPLTRIFRDVPPFVVDVPSVVPGGTVIVEVAVGGSKRVLELKALGSSADAPSELRLAVLKLP